MEVKRFPRLYDRVIEVITNLLERRLVPTNEMVIIDVTCFDVIIIKHLLFIYIV